MEIIHSNEMNNNNKDLVACILKKTFNVIENLVAGFKLLNLSHLLEVKVTIFLNLFMNTAGKGWLFTSAVVGMHNIDTFSTSGHEAHMQ
jgi:uncharacterized protein YggT (Ycf19 family)